MPPRRQSCGELSAAIRYLGVITSAGYWCAGRRKTVTDFQGMECMCLMLQCQVYRLRVVIYHA